jgi:RNA polymerase sigma-70 factor (ECF subfamily)
VKEEADTEALQWARAFVAARPSEAPVESRLEALAARLRERFTEGQAAHPGVVLSGETFSRYAGARTLKGADALEAVAQLQAADLFLACACVEGDPQALTQLEAAFARVRPAVRRLDASDDFLDEVLQQLRERLLLEAPGRGKKLAEYSGRGGLLSWLRTVATGTALNLLRERHPARAANDAKSLSQLEMPNAGLEASYLQLKHGEDFRAAFRQALRGLEARERNLLRLRFVEGLKSEQLARLHNVHATTVMRWLERTQAQVLEQTRRHLAERLTLTPSEVDSLVELLRSQVEISFGPLLSDAGA